MKYYFFIENNQRFGPFTVDQLKTKQLTKSILFWTEGMQEWTNGTDIEELKDILISEPPPLPKKAAGPSIIEIIKQFKLQLNPAKISKFDLTYEKELDALLIGLAMLFFNFIFLIIPESQVRHNYFTPLILSIVTLSIRIAITLWVMDIASRQNRNRTGWGWFTFCLPTLALIVIGQLKKLKIELGGNVSAVQLSDFEKKLKELDVLIKKQKSFYFSHDDTKRSILLLLSSLIKSKEEAFIVIETYKQLLDKDLIEELKGLVSCHVSNQYLSRFIDFKVITERHDFLRFYYEYYDDFI